MPGPHATITFEPHVQLAIFLIGLAVGICAILFALINPEKTDGKRQR